MHSDNRRVTMTGVTLKRCIMGAYGVGQNEVIGGPDWLDQDLFDIQAKAEGETALSLAARRGETEVTKILRTAESRGLR